MTDVTLGVTAIRLRPDDDSPHVYWVRGVTGGALIDAGHGEEDVSQRVITTINRLRGGEPAPELLLLTDRFDEHSGNATALKAAFIGLKVHAGSADAAAITESTGTIIDTPLNGGEAFSLGDGGQTIRAIATPGHTPGSMCYLLEPDGVLFSGDCVLSDGTTAIRPSEGGEMAAYVASLHTLADLNARLLLSFHGPPVTNPAARLAELIEHRHARDEAIIECLRGGITDVDEIRERLYGAANLPEWRWNAAREQIIAHLIKLMADGAVVETEAGKSYSLT